MQNSPPSSGAEDEEDTGKRFALSAMEELRVETEDERGIHVKLKEGTAEIFGVEMAIDRQYHIKNQKIAIFTYRGCTLMIAGETSLAYKSKETPMVTFVNTHHNLEIMRQISFDSGAPGPRVLVVGPEDSGKTTFSHVLLNYAIRSGHTPIYVDLDVSMNELAAPGAIAASPLVHPRDIEEDEFPSTLPLAYFYGSTSPVENKEHFETCVDKLSETLDRRMQRQSKESCSGYVIDTAPWSESLGVGSITLLAAKFKVDIICVLGHERLAVLLKQQPSLQEAQIVAVPKSGGVVSRDLTYRRQALNRKFRKYFYGRDNELNPRQLVVSFTELGIYRVGGTPQAPSSTLPIGEARLLKPNQILPVTPSQEFQHSVLALSTAKEPSQLMTAPMCGFLYVSGLDLKRKTLTLLSPQAGPLPASCLLYGTTKWYDQ